MFFTAIAMFLAIGILCAICGGMEELTRTKYGVIILFIVFVVFVFLVLSH